jgi:hypothetical protein
MPRGIDDHPFTIVVGTVVAIGSYLVFSIPWYHALIAAMIVSGILEFAIKEVPPDSDEYDPAQYQLWAAADAQKDTTVSAEAETDVDDPLDSLRDRYARGEITEEEFEQKAETLLETELIAEPEQTEDSEDILTEHN